MTANMKDMNAKLLKETESKFQEGLMEQVKSTQHITRQT